MKGHFENKSTFENESSSRRQKFEKIFKEKLTPLYRKIVVKVVRLFAVFLFLHSYASCTTKVILVAGST